MIIIRQKEYTSFKYKVNAKVGRVRANIAEKIGNVAIKHMDNYDKAVNKMSVAPKIIDDSLYKKSIIAGHNLGARTITDIYGNTDTTGGTAVLNSQGFINDLQKNGVDINKFKDRKLTNAIKKNKNLILVKNSVKPSIETHAHEVGHVVNNNSGGIINKIARNSKIKQERNNFMDTDNSSSIKDSIKRAIHGAAVIKEEKRANKYALGFLKRNNLERSKMKLAKENLDNALNTYKEAYKVGVLMPIYRKIQIPGRK